MACARVASSTPLIASPPVTTRTDCPLWRVIASADTRRRARFLGRWGERDDVGGEWVVLALHDEGFAVRVGRCVQAIERFIGNHDLTGLGAGLEPRRRVHDVT